MTMSNDDDEITYALIVDEEDDIEIIEDNVVINIHKEEISIIEEEPSDIRHPIHHLGKAHRTEITTTIEDEDGFVNVERETETILDVIEEDEHGEDVVIDSFVAKRKQRIKLSKLNKRKVKLYSFFGIAALLTLMVLILESPMFTIDKVNIVQEKDSVQLTADEIKVLKKDLEPVKDQQMYRSNFNSSNSKINNLTFVKDVSFKKDWPSTVNVSITHRVAIATIKTDKGFVLVDDENMVFSKVQTLPVGLPLFKGFDQVTFAKQISDKNYVSILNNSPEEIVNQIAAVTKKDSKYFVTLTDGIVVKLGDTSLMKEKLAIAWSIILTKNRAQLGYIDVSVPSLPVSGIPKPQV